MPESRAIKLSHSWIDRGGVEGGFHEWLNLMAHRNRFYRFTLRLLFAYLFSQDPVLSNAEIAVVASGRDGSCTPVPSVFDNYCNISIRQTFRTGLQTPSGPREGASTCVDTRAFRYLMPGITAHAGTLRNLIVNIILRRTYSKKFHKHL